MEDVLATVRELFGEGHATYAAVLDTLSSRMHDAGDFDAAKELSNEALVVWKKIYGDEHPNVAISLARLGQSLRAQGEDDEAERALRRALSILDGASDAPGLAGYDARIALADLLSNRGEYTEAEELLRESLDLLRASPSRTHFRIIETIERLVTVQLNQPEADARDTMRQMYEETHSFYPDTSPLLAISAMGYGRQIFENGDAEAAIPYFREAIDRFRASPNPPRISFLAACDGLFQILRGKEDVASIKESDDLLRDIIDLARTMWGVDSLATNLKYYASRLVERGRHADALNAIMDAHQSFVDAGRSIDERENLRDNMAMIAFQVAVKPELETELYATARYAAELALTEEPNHPAMLVALAVALYRLDELALSAEMLDRIRGPLSKMRGGLARGITPADHAFRAMTYARLGNEAVARAELEAMRAVIAEKNGNADAPEILREVEAVVEQSSSSVEDE